MNFTLTITYHNANFNFVIRVTTTADGLEISLNDFVRNKIPTIVASTGADVGRVVEQNWGTENLGAPIVVAPSLAIPVVALQEIFEVMSFKGTSMKVEESHQSTKNDPSGTAKNIIGIFTKNGGTCVVEDEESYSKDGISKLGDLTCYRGKSSQEHFNVPDEYMGGHGVHRFIITLNTNDKNDIQEFEFLKKFLREWHDKYSKMGLKGMNFDDIEITENQIIICERVYGRAIYAQGAEYLMRNGFMCMKSGLYTPSQCLINK